MKNTNSWSMIARTKGGRLRGGLLGVPCRVCLGSANQDGSKRLGEEKSSTKVGGGSCKSLLLAMAQKGGDELNARRRGAVSWPPLPIHQPESVVVKVKTLEGWAPPEDLFSWPKLQLHQQLLD